MTNLSSLERDVIAMLVAGEHVLLTILREQATAVAVLNRKFTGVGFYTELWVPPHTPRVECPRNFKLGDVNGTATNIKNGLGFLLYVEEGALSLVEGYTYDEPWPKEIRNLTLSYSTGGQRDLEGLQALFLENDMRR